MRFEFSNDSTAKMFASIVSTIITNGDAVRVKGKRVTVEYQYNPYLARYMATREDEFKPIFENSLEFVKARYPLAVGIVKGYHDLVDLYLNVNHVYVDVRTDTYRARVELAWTNLYPIDDLFRSLYVFALLCGAKQDGVVGRW